MLAEIRESNPEIRALRRGGVGRARVDAARNNHGPVLSGELVPCVLIQP